MRKSVLTVKRGLRPAPSSSNSAKERGWLASLLRQLALPEALAHIFLSPDQVN
jgi:hypothetical protein